MVANQSPSAAAIAHVPQPPAVAAHAVRAAAERGGWWPTRLHLAERLHVLALARALLVVDGLALGLLRLAPAASPRLGQAPVLGEHGAVVQVLERADARDRGFAAAQQYRAGEARCSALPLLPRARCPLQAVSG